MKWIHSRDDDASSIAHNEVRNSRRLVTLRNAVRFFLAHFDLEETFILKSLRDEVNLADRCKWRSGSDLVILLVLRYRAQSIPWVAEGDGPAAWWGYCPLLGQGH